MTWHEFQGNLPGEEKSRVLDAPLGSNAPGVPRYFDKTREELEEDFAWQIAELDLLSALGLLAATEATLRVDCIRRTKDKKEDKVSRRFLQTSRAVKDLGNIRREEDILDICRAHGLTAGMNHAVSEFKGVLKLRNWLAHGRYGTAKLGRAGGYKAADVFDVCKRMLQVVGLMPLDVP